MSQVHDLRLLFENAYFESQTPQSNITSFAELKRRRREKQIEAASLLPFLAVPLKMRLILLSLYDQATMYECKQTLPWMKETDYRLSSKRIAAALATLGHALEEPTYWLNPGPYPDEEPFDLLETDSITGELPPFPIADRHIPRDTDKQLRQALFPSTAVMLFGDTAPWEIVELDLRTRVIVYLLVVEEMGWEEIRRLLECSDYAIRQAIAGAKEALGQL